MTMGTMLLRGRGEGKGVPLGLFQIFHHGVNNGLECPSSRTSALAVFIS
jgi:hypothetical protein